MIYALFQQFSGADFPGHHLMDYITFRSGISLALAMLSALVFGRMIIDRLQRRQIGETVRNLGLEGQMKKAGTPTMGGLMFIIGIGRVLALQPPM